MGNNDFYKPINVSLTPEEVRHYYDVNESLPAHDFVIRPLLINCKEALVYGVQKESDLYRNNSEILINDKGKFKFDKNKEKVFIPRVNLNLTCLTNFYILSFTIKFFDYYSFIRSLCSC
jgi:hypothetical protein